MYSDRLARHLQFPLGGGINNSGASNKFLSFVIQYLLYVQLVMVLR